MLPNPAASETSPLLANSDANAQPTSIVAPQHSLEAPSSSSSSTLDNIGDNADDSDDEEAAIYTVPQTRLVVILVSANISTFLVSADHTILATLSGPISDSIASLSFLPYLAAIYYLNTAASVAISGRLSDVFGRGPCITVSMLLVALGTLMCGLAPERGEDGSVFWGVTTFLAGRALTGMGVGAMLTVPQILNTELVPPRMRGLIYGIRSSVGSIGMISGGFLGGLINDMLGWRWAFLIQVPICTLVAIISWNIIKIPPRVSKSGKSYLARIDFTGVLLIFLWLVLFQVPLNAGGTLVPWTNPLLAISFALSAAAAITLARREWKARNPIIPTRLLAENRNFLAASLISSISVALVITAVYNVPLFFEVVAGDSSTDAGLRIIVQSIGSMISALGGGWLLKTTDRYILVTHVALFTGLVAFSLWCFIPTHVAIVGPPLSFNWTNLAIFLVGLGLVTVNNSVTLIGVESVAPTSHAVVLATMQLMREIGATIGLASSSAVLANVMRASLRRQFGDRPGAAKDIEKIIESVLSGELPEGWKREEIIGAFADGFHGVWTVAAITTVVALVIAMFMKRRPWVGP